MTDGGEYRAKKKRGTVTHNILNNVDKNKRQMEEDNQSKKKQTKDGPNIKKKPTFRDLIGSLFFCFRKSKKNDCD